MSKWSFSKWFGGFKLECDECRFYSVSDSEKTCIIKMHTRFYDYGGFPHCSACAREHFPFAKANDRSETLTVQLDKSNTALTQLQEKFVDWKNEEYYRQQMMACLYEWHPAIDSEPIRRHVLQSRDGVSPDNAHNPDSLKNHHDLYARLAQKMQEARGQYIPIRDRVQPKQKTTTKDNSNQHIRSESNRLAKIELERMQREAK